jgi:urease accessory protein UreE
MKLEKKTYREFGHKHVERTLKMNKINLEDSDKLTIILSKILLLDEDDILFWGKNEEEK